MTGFDAFWAAWPKNRVGGYQRKGGKAECLKIWTKGHYETQWQTIVHHVHWLCTTSDWLKNNGAYVPMPSTYLRGQRWDGAEVPESIATAQMEDMRAKWAAEDAKACKPSPELRAKLASFSRRANLS